ncbi:MAG TPA: MopE-related protein, partial [Anaeromyxobacteraceae bacterium]
DDDCNGVVDDGIAPRSCYSAGSGCTPSGGGFTCAGTCRPGTQTCVAGAFGACTGEVTPAAEVCNGLDDDCNGTADDAVPPPGGVAACYTGPADTRGVGVCRDGAWTCSSGTWGCAGERLPGFEICEPSGADDNCDGQVDENCACVPGTSQPCYSGPAGTAGIGACRAGEQSCSQVAGQPAGIGAWGACTGEVKPSAETCNGVDDDCNGTVDDGGACDQCAAGATRPCYTGAPATRGVGVCRDGVESCAAGQWSGSCSGQVIPAQELCNGLDDDCDGAPDAGAACNPGLACLNGVCTFPSCGTPESSCGPGYVCNATSCEPAPCPTGPCPTGQVCQGGACADPCAGKSCAPGSFCSGGTCTGGGCHASGCPAGELCRGGTCAADPCAGLSCPAGTFCRGGDCVQACAFVSCAVGERCDTDGFCIVEPCSGKTCGAGEICQGGTCVPDPCAGQGCGASQVCTGGLCVDDPCAGVTCPAGQCIRGQCFASNNLSGDGQPPRQTSGGKSGCGCGGGLGEAGPAALLLALLAPLRLRRRRPSFRALALPLAALAAAGLLSACGGSKKAPTNPDGTPCESCGTSACVDVKFDAAHCGTCAHACAGGEVCVDTVCGPGSPVAPFLRSAAPAPVASGTSPTFTLDGDRFQAGATLRLAGVLAPAEVATSGSGAQLSAQVSLAGAPTGKLTLRVVNPDRVVSNLYSVDVVTPTPAITSISPPSALAGTQLTVAVSGSGFTAFSVCILQVAGQPDAGLPTVAGAGSLSCDLDLRLVPVGTVQILVQNEGGVRSAALPFEVTASTPTLVSVSPSAGQPGDVPRLLLTGTGFTPGCAAQFGQGGTYRSLVTTYVAPTRLQADLALAGDLPGAYEVRVFADASHVSGTLPFTVNPTAPTATGLALTPATPRIGDTGVLLDFTGSGFDGACAVELQKPGGGGVWTAVSSTAVLSPSSVRGTADMTGSPGTWYGHVSCPLGDTAAFPFQVQDNVAVLVSVTPAGGRQGTTQSLAVTGSNFVAGISLELSGIGAPTVLTPGSVTSTSLSASVNLTGWEAGNYVLRAQNPGAGFSNGLAFAVTPGAPTLSSVAVAGGGNCAVQSATPTAVTLSGTNFAPGQSAVHASSPLVPDVDLSTLAGTTVTVQSASSILVSLDTSGVVPGDYCVSVWNPGSPSVQKSAKLPFEVAAVAGDCATPPAACP